MLRMIDRVDGVWPDAIRVRKRVDAGEWFFKAHFFKDPVLPGSLGVQAMLQTSSRPALIARRADKPEDHKALAYLMCGGPFRVRKKL
jgi:3-hydroxymyristoyl/3-hydroxydecanoyl-(acyl carrier protein) dehydratase